MTSAISRRPNAAEQKLAAFGLNPLPPRTASSGTGDDANWWMITLSDLTLLLLGFLVVWYTTEKKMKSAEQSPLVIQSAATKPAAMVAPWADDVRSNDWKSLENEMESFIAKAGLAHEVSVESTQTDLLLSLTDAVPFASGKAELKAEALPILEKVVTLALSHPLLSMQIVGHTDDVPIATGVFPSNWELSAARASRVARYLIEKGIDPMRIAVQGYANERPKAPNSNVRNRAANRRVEIRLYYSNNENRAPESPLRETN